MTDAWKQRSSLTDEYLEDILLTSTSYITPEYDWIFAEKGRIISHEVCKVIRKSQTCSLNGTFFSVSLIHNYE